MAEFQKSEPRLITSIVRRLVTRRSIPVPTWQGFVVILVFFGVLSGLGVSLLHPFLALNRQVSSSYLVVEGWVPDYAMQEAVEIFRKGGCKKIFVTGGPLEIGSSLSQYKTFGELGAQVLVRLGVPEQAVVAVPALKVKKDRTYASAVALKERLQTSGEKVEAFNILSLGVHARRTRLLFEAAFGDQVGIGMISVKDHEFEPSRWWLYSAGFRTVFSELVAYVYARLIFHP